MRIRLQEEIHSFRVRTRSLVEILVAKLSEVKRVKGISDVVMGSYRGKESSSRCVD
jgi:hypothetical protein